ncbi:MAG: ABC-2 family transporter protein [Bacillota bacterium]|jgi:ABC-2 type transport system permease protein
MQKYTIIARLSATRGFDGGLLYVLGGYLMQLARLIILLLLWRSLAEQGADLGGFTLGELLLYTLFSSVLSEQLNVVTPATTAFWEGSFISNYLHPLPIVLQLIAETVGSWLPGLLLYSIPMLAISPLLGIDLAPLLSNALPFVVSLFCAISLGFALDFIFASLVIHVQHASYTAYSIRQAVIKLFSGALIPFALLPEGLGRIFELLPFGSVASAPLLILCGSSEVARLLSLQLLWNAILWPLALIMLRHSQERMVSYGG